MISNARNGEATFGDTKMSYVSFGRGERVLILIPGLSDGLTTVKGRALLLAKPYALFFERYTVYMFSRRDDLPSDHSIRDMANDQADAMKALGISKACIMGVSQGGMIAQYLAIDHPEMTEKLVLAVSAPDANDRIKAAVTKWVGFAKQGKHKELMIDTAEMSYSQEYLKKYRKFYPFISFVGKPADYDRFLANADAILGFDAFHELNKISCPTLIIGGEEDQVVGVQASYDMHAQIAGSELYVYPGLGHAAYEEAKDFNQRVYDFLEAETSDT